MNDIRKSNENENDKLGFEKFNVTIILTFHSSRENYKWKYLLRFTLNEI
jgi:hypothetical protein